MVSNNTFTHLAKTGDVLTAILAYGEDVNVPVITIDDNNAEESDLGSEQFQALYTFLGTEPEGPVNTLQSVTTDYLGNGGTYNGGSTGEGSLTVFYDRTLPTLDPVTIISNNFSYNQNLHFGKLLEDLDYYWLEEPISADNSLNEIIYLINNHKNLAFGENITQTNNFVELNDDTSIKFLQPDIARYGGISQIISLKDKIVTDKLYLHYLGGAVGLITSAHLMSAINQNGFLEYDINENALRTDILKPAVKIRDGYLLLNSSIGIGFNLSEMSKNYLNQYYEL